MTQSHNPFPPHDPRSAQAAPGAQPRAQARPKRVPSPRDRVSRNKVVELLMNAGHPDAKRALRGSTREAKQEAELEILWGILETMEMLRVGQNHLNRVVTGVASTYYPPIAPHPQPGAVQMAGAPPAQAPTTAPDPMAQQPQAAGPVPTQSSAQGGPPPGSAAAHIPDPPAHLLDDMEGAPGADDGDIVTELPKHGDFSDELAELGLAGSGPVDFSGPPMATPPANLHTVPVPDPAGDNGLGGEPPPMANVSKPTGPIDTSAATDAD